MDIMVVGRTYPDGRAVAEPIGEHDLAQRVLASLEPQAERLQRDARLTKAQDTFRGELRRAATVDLGNPKAAGWTVLVADSDPRAERLVEAVAVLARHRGVEKPAPLVFNHQAEWSDWLDANYRSLDRPPHYILILGGPDQIPFLFQAFLDTGAAVGRLDFESVDDFAEYAEKVVRLETAPDPVPTDSAVFFAPDGGYRDPTHFSRRFMVEPLMAQVANDFDFATVGLLGETASKPSLLETLHDSRAALIYTASHGAIDYVGPIERQHQMNGAICCQIDAGGEFDEGLVAAADVPPGDEPFLEGSIFFQFACFGYGTPAQSGFAHWGVPVPEVNASEDFVAALPKRLLAHRRGPVAFVGHLDVALLHGFDDPEAPEVLERWHPRLEPFRDAVQQILERQPIGYALSELNHRYASTSATLANTYDRMRSGTLIITPEVEARLANTFLVRNDAQNYLILGDPGAGVRISSER